MVAKKKKKKKEIQYSVHRNVEMVVPGWGAGLAGVGRKPLLSPTIRLVETTDVTESSQRLRSLRLLREQEIIWEILRDVLDERWRIVQTGGEHGGNKVEINLRTDFGPLSNVCAVLR